MRVWKKIVLWVCCFSLLLVVVLKPVVQVKATAVVVPVGIELFEILAAFLAALGIGISIDSYMSTESDGTTAIDEDKVNELYNDLKVAYDASASGGGGEDPDPEDFDKLLTAAGNSGIVALAQDSWECLKGAAETLFDTGRKIGDYLGGKTIEEAFGTSDVDVRVPSGLSFNGVPIYFGFSTCGSMNIDVLK